MPKGLPDSVTYTMGKRIMRVSRDKTAERYERLESNALAVETILSMVIYAIGGTLLAALYVIGSPFILINYLSKRAEARKAREERKARYERAKAKHAQKVS